MSRDPALRLEDIIEAATAVNRYIQGFDFDSFVADRRTVDAVTRNLEIIGEAVKHLPSELTDPLPQIPWRAIAGFRDILAHSYFRTEDSIIWDAATIHNPALINAAHALLKHLWLLSVLRCRSRLRPVLQLSSTDNRPLFLFSPVRCSMFAFLLPLLHKFHP
ncbi:MAG: DUF86 domain-containing protein [Verrucomicrobiota bacterium]